MLDFRHMGQTLTVAVGLSGGVDSSVAAATLLELGYRVIGLTMSTGDLGLTLSEELGSGARGACIGPGEEEDIAACQRLCSRLGVEYRAFDASEEFRRIVLGYFRDEYRAGRTPNPCVVCNSELKFKLLVERARESGLAFDLFATGHYARIEEKNGVARLRAAAYSAKDQSYFLYRLGPELLSGVLFPLGGMRKDEVRAAARRLGLEAADKPDSQDFIAGGDFSPIFAADPPPPGDIVDLEGRVLGRHRGLPYYTIGQRRGLGIGAASGDGGEAQPLYVIAIDAGRNRVVVGPDDGLFAEALVASSFLLYADGPGEGRRGLAKIRQNHRPTPCTFSPSPDGSCRVDFDDPQRAIAPGQSVVIYDEEGFVLGGGIIESAARARRPA
jgi:tRNA-uridine 2-sulfurtransferase